MRNQLVRKAASVFMALVLVFTCNSATVQPLAAFATSDYSPQENVQPAAPDEGAGSDVQPDDVVVPDDADADLMEVPQEPCDISEDADVLGIALKGIVYVNADGIEALVDVVDGCADTTDVDVAAATSLQLVYRLTIDPQILHANDFLTLRAPEALLLLAPEDKLVAANADMIQRATCAVVEGDVRVALTAEALEAAESFELEVRVPVELAADALGEELVEARIPLQGDATATVLLPAKTSEEKSAVEESLPAPLTVPSFVPKADETNVTLDKYWADNNDSARPVDKLTGVGALKVYFTIDNGVQTELTEITEGQLGITGDIPGITADKSGTNHTIYTCAGLPSAVINGGDSKTVSYVIEEDADKALALGYVQQRSSDDKLYNVKTTSFTANVTVRDGGQYNDPNNVFTLYKDDVKISIEDAEWNFDKATGTGSYKVVNLPMYNLDGSQITYYAKAPEAPASPNDDYYYPEYDNVIVPNHGTNTTECYDKGTINLTLVGEAAYTATKVWLDDGAVEKRPDATFYLWRYTQKGDNGFAQASQVRDDNNAPIVVNLTGEDKKASKFEFTVAHGITADLKNLPKYDPEGYPYIYLTRETLSGGTASYEQVFGVVDEKTFEVTDMLPAGVKRVTADKSLYNGGMLSNRISATVDVSKKKTWKASAYQNDLGTDSDVSVTLTLQSRLAGSADDTPWTDVETQVLSGFLPEIMTKTVQASPSKYDALGRELEYRWVETSVMQKGTERLKDDGTFRLDCNSVDINDPANEHRDVEWFSSTDEPIVEGSDESWIVNRLEGEVDYTIDKTWKQNDGTYGKNPPEEGASITVEIFQNGKSMSPVQQCTMDGVVDEVNHETSPYHVYVNDLPKYDNEGRLYSYVAEEVSGYGSWHSTYAHDVANRITNIKNDPTGSGNIIRVGKEWIDDSDVEHRYPVTVQVHKKNLDGTAGEAVGGPVVLSTENDWWTWVSVPAGTSYTDYVLEEVNLRNPDGTVYTPNKDGAPLTVTTDKHIYLVTSGQNDQMKMLTVTNKRIGVINLTVTKKWVDQGNEANRPEATFTLKAVERTATVNEDEVSVVGGGTLPIQDNAGNPVKSVQQVANGADKTESTNYFFNLPKYDETGKVIHYIVEETYADDSDNRAKAADYVISSTQVYYVGDIHTHDRQNVEFTNQRAGTRDVVIHKQWKDAYAYKNGKRPDIYLTLWKIDSTAQSGPEELGYYPYQWAARSDGGADIDAENEWTATFKGMPKYDTNGGEITYYAQESTNLDSSVFDYVGATYLGADGVTAVTGGEDVKTVKKDGSDVTILRENDTFVNAIKKSVTIEGKKLWEGIPTGFPLAQLPNIKVNISQYVGNQLNIRNIASTKKLSQVANTNEYTFAVTKTGENDDGGGVDLPKYDEMGQLYTYKAEEEFLSTPPDGTTWDKIYALGGYAFVLRNVFNTGDGNTGSLKVSKAWVDHPAGQPYPAATFKLHRAYAVNGQPERSDDIIDTKTLASSASATDAGQVVFENLLVYAPDGQKYQYLVEEEGIDGYTSEVADITKDKPVTLTVGGAVEVSVKNTYNQKGVIELSGTKVWDDYDDAFGLRPQDVSLELHRWADKQSGQDNSISDEVVVVDGTAIKLDWSKEKNTWTYTYTGLERYAPNGTAWKYKVVEQGSAKLAPYGLDAGAKKTVNANTTDTATGIIAMNSLTNTLSTKAVVTKKWEDGNDAYKLRPTTATVKLQVKAGDAVWEDASVVFNGVSGMDTFGVIELNAKNGWSHTYSKLPSAKVVKNQDSTTLVTPYVYRFAEVEIGGTAGIEIQQDGTYVVTDGKNHTYTPSGTVADSTTTITNTMQDIGKTSLTVKKEWVNDSNDAFGTRPQKAGTSDGTWEITFALERKVNASDQDSWEEVNDTAGQSVVLSLSGSASEGSKSTTFDNLPKFNVDGSEYVYRARELPVTGYTTTSTYTYADSAGVANSTTFTNALETVEVGGLKTWVDVDGSKNNRPSVGLTLYRESDAVAKEQVMAAPVPIWSNADTNSWTYAYPNVLPKFDCSGNVYTYTVAETPVPDGYWASSRDASGLDVTNTQTKFKLDKVDAAGGAGTTPVPVNDVTLSIYKKGADAPAAPLVTWTRDASDKVAIAGAAGSSVVGDGDFILGLPQGDYVLKETKTPAAYVPAADIPFTLKADGTLSSTTANAVSGDLANDITLTMKNRLAKGHVELTKTIADGKKGTVEGVEFSLYKKGSPDKLLSEHLTTDDKGTWSSKAVFPDGLEVGSYYFVETKATDDTVLSSRHADFEVKNTDDGKTIAVTAINTSFAASLVLSKLDGTTGDALVGSEFTLSYTPESGGAATNTVLTSADGSIFKVDNLKKGTYTLKETTLPNGYEDAFEATFTLTDADNGKVVVARDGEAGAEELVATKTAGTWVAGGVTNTRILGSLSLTKVAVWTSKGLQGAEFTLTGPNSYKNILTTDANGKLSVDGLAWGKYTVTETKAPAGYMLGETPWTKTFTVGPVADDVKLAWDLGKVDNTATRVSLLKVDDAIQANPMKGANLVLKGAFANTTKTELAWMSVEAPWVLENSLIVGNEYTLSESGRVSGYLALDKAVVKFKVDDDGKITVTENPKLVDGAGAASVSSDGLTLSLRNIKIVGSAELTKTDENRTPLQGVTFNLYAAGADEPLYEGLETDNSGKIKVEGLAEGSYRFVETATLDGKVLDPRPLDFAIGEGDHAKVKPLQMSNGDFRSSVSLVKVDATSGDALAGVQFTLSKQNATGEFTPVGNSVATNENGSVLFPLVEKGTYRVQETAAAIGYTLDADKPYTATFTVDNTANFQGKTLELSESVDADTAQKYNLVVENALYKGGKVANERKLGSVALRKIDAETGAGLNGVGFSLFAADDPDQPLGVFVAGNAYATPDGNAPTAAGNGELSIAGLGWGNYYLQETKADGYQLVNDKLEFTIEASNAGSAPSVDRGSVSNAPIEFSFLKTELYAESCSDATLSADAADATRALAGAEFTVFADAACSAAAQSAVGKDLVAASDAAGKVSFSLVKAGTYYVKETVVPVGHQPNDVVYQLVVKEDGAIERFSSVDDEAGVLEEIVNDVNRADIRLKKVSENDEGKVLPNSTYGLYKRTATSDGNLARVRVSLQAVDAALEPGLQLIAKATTGTDGYLSFEGILMNQEYVIRELVAPDGSLVSEHPIAITFTMVDGKAKVTSFDDGSGTAEVDVNGNIVWREPQVIVEFAKKNPEGELLAGATLQVVDKSGTTVVEPWVSEASAGHRVEGVLVAGESYRLVELEAPDGYVVAEEVPFTVDDHKRGPQEGYVQHVEMTDERVPTVPAKPQATKGLFGFLAKTGDTPLGVLVGGVALATVGIAAAASVRRRRKRL